MKTTIVMLLAVIVSITCNAEIRDGNNIPDNVQKSFSQQYAQAGRKSWETKNDTFVARFTMSKRKCNAFYLSNGDWIKTETKIPWSWKLPNTVKNGWDHCMYCSWYIDEIKQIETPGKNIFVIQVHHDDGPEGSIPGDNYNVYKLYFDANGSLLKKEHLTN